MSERLQQTVSGSADIPEDALLYLTEQAGGTVNGWILFGEETLEEQIDLDGRITPRWALPSGFAESLRAAGIFATNGVVHPIDALSRMVALGSSNGDYLFVSSLGVFAFRHDGHELELIANTWADFTSSDEAEPSNLLSSLIGIWEPSHSETEPEEMFSIFCPVLHFRESGEAEQDVGDESLMWKWTTEPGRIRLSGDDGTVYFRYQLNESGLELRSLDGDYHCHYVKR